MDGATHWRKFMAVIAVSLLGVAGAPSTASAADGDKSKKKSGADSSLRVQGFARFGFGGQLEYSEPEALSDADAQDMKTTHLVGAEVDYPLHKFVLVGGRAELGWATPEAPENSDEDRKRDTLLNIDAVVKGRYPISRDFEVYASVPIGLTMLFLNDENVRDNASGSGKPTLNFSINAGANYFFTDSLGAFAEVGWWNQPVAYKVEPDQGDSQDYKGRFSQITTTLGFIYRM